jgi:hypothetical protein
MVNQVNQVKVRLRCGVFNTKTHERFPTLWIERAI